MDVTTVVNVPNVKSSFRSLVLVHGIACAIYLGVTIVAAVCFPSTRLTSDGSYYGLVTVVGWPHVYFAMREESVAMTTKHPMQIVATRFSIVAIILDCVGVVAIIELFRHLVSFVKCPRTTITKIAMATLWIGVLCGTAVASRHSFLKPILLYPERAYEKRNDGNSGEETGTNSVRDPKVLKVGQERPRNPPPLVTRRLPRQ